VAEQWGVIPYYIRFSEAKGSDDKTKMAADVEALVGAVHLDDGLKECQALVKKFLIVDPFSGLPDRRIDQLNYEDEITQ
jgi:dsRNA-specific ribonuclease